MARDTTTDDVVEPAMEAEEEADGTREVVDDPVVGHHGDAEEEDEVVEDVDGLTKDLHARSEEGDEGDEGAGDRRDVEDAVDIEAGEDVGDAGDTGEPEISPSSHEEFQDAEEGSAEVD